MAKAQKPRTFSERLDELRAIVEKLEGGALPLEDAVQGFEEGRKLHQELLGELSGYEKRLETMLAEPGQPALPARDDDDAEPGN